MIDDEIERVKQEFCDVIGIQPDLTGFYKSKPPEWLVKSRERMKSKFYFRLKKQMTKTQLNNMEDRVKFEEYYMRKKK